MVGRNPDQARVDRSAGLEELEPRRLWRTFVTSPAGSTRRSWRTAGLVAALEAQARKTHAADDRRGRRGRALPQEIESAVYFCALEALNNIAKYARATRVDIRLAVADGVLVCEVIDDGRGFDVAGSVHGTGLQGMADRLDAIGGRLEVRSVVGEGTHVIGLRPRPGAAGMTDRTARRVARGAWFVAIGLSAASIGLFVATLDVRPAGSAVDFALQSLPFMLAASTLGALIVSRHPRNLVGWLLCYCALVLALTDALQHYTVFAYLGGHPDLPLARWAAWFQSFGIGAFFPIVLALLILVFPDGRLPSPRWRVFVAAALLLEAVGLTAMALQKGALPISCCEAKLPVSNPLGLIGAATTQQSWGGFLVFFFGFLLVFPASVVGLLLKRRRADPETRQQIRWLASVGLLVAVGLLSTTVLQFVLPERWRGAGDAALSGVLLILAIGVPVAMAVAVLKYRLYDLDLVIRKTVVFTVVAFTLTALYLGVLAVATIGAVSRVLVGVILLAVTFSPVRNAARSIADRVVYGRARVVLRGPERDSPGGWPRRMRPRTCPPGWRRSSPVQPARSRPACGCGSATRCDPKPSPARTARWTPGRSWVTPFPRSPARRRSRCGIRASCSAPSRWRCRATIRSTPAANGWCTTSPPRPAWCSGTSG